MSKLVKWLGSFYEALRFARLAKVSISETMDNFGIGVASRAKTLKEAFYDYHKGKFNRPWHCSEKTALEAWKKHFRYELDNIKFGGCWSKNKTSFTTILSLLENDYYPDHEDEAELIGLGFYAAPSVEDLSKLVCYADDLAEGDDGAILTNLKDEIDDRLENSIDLVAKDAKEIKGYYEQSYKTDDITYVFARKYMQSCSLPELFEVYKQYGKKLWAKNTRSKYIFQDFVDAVSKHFKQDKDPIDNMDFVIETVKVVGSIRLMGRTNTKELLTQICNFAVKLCGDKLITCGEDLLATGQLCQQVDTLKTLYDKMGIDACNKLLSDQLNKAIQQVNEIFVSLPPATSATEAKASFEAVSDIAKDTKHAALLTYISACKTFEDVEPLYANFEIGVIVNTLKGCWCRKKAKKTYTKVSRQVAKNELDNVVSIYQMTEKFAHFKRYGLEKPARDKITNIIDSRSYHNAGTLGYNDLVEIIHQLKICEYNNCFENEIKYAVSTAKVHLWELCSLQSKADRRKFIADKIRCPEELRVYAIHEYQRTLDKKR